MHWETKKKSMSFTLLLYSLNRDSLELSYTCKESESVMKTFQQRKV